MKYQWHSLYNKDYSRNGRITYNADFDNSNEN